MPAGRPKKTLDDLPEDWENKVLEEYQNGASDVEIFRGVLKIGKSTWIRLLQEEEQFSTTIKQGKELAEIWWMKKSRSGMNEKYFNTKLFEINMMNRFGWGKNVNNKNEHEIKGNPFEGLGWDNDKED